MVGGMMRFGIPKYRLPREVLDAEAQRILDLGVELELNTKVANIEESMREGGFDAAFLAVGAHIGKRAYIPAGEAARILDAVSLLESMEGEERPLLGRRVVVYGGGDTAIDAAGPRSASARPTPSSSTDAPASGCPPTTSRSRRPRRRA
jgi:NADPH-dependent glutamate synthase beta subunit-like oxidoreductase